MPTCNEPKDPTRIGAARAHLQRLALKRDAFPLPLNFAHVNQFHNGIYATKDYVVPWTKAACNLDASVMIVLQDWNSVNGLASLPIDHHQAVTGQSRAFATNTRIRNLLRTYFRLSFCQTYATDLVPFAKPGNRRASIPFNFLVKCARDFTIHEISIVRPCVLLAVSIDVFNALYSVYHAGAVANVGTTHFDIVFNDNCKTRVFRLSHPQRPLVAAERDREWRRASDYYKLSCSNTISNLPSQHGANVHAQVDSGSDDVTSNHQHAHCLLWQQGTCRAQCP
jgi:hypothetical protein